MLFLSKIKLVFIILFHYWTFIRMRYRQFWTLCKLFTQFNTFVYEDKRIYIELDDKRKVYAVKVMPSKVICLRVPLKSYLRIRTTRMSSEIIRHALQIREKYAMNKNKSNDNSQRDRDQILDRIVKIESTLETMETTLKAISERLSKQ